MNTGFWVTVDRDVVSSAEHKSSTGNVCSVRHGTKNLSHTER